MQVFGHRGSPGVPRKGENTLASFRRAIADGADGIELDIRRSVDGRIIVIHDASPLPYAELRTAAVPLLSDVLDEFAGRCLINVEVKETGLAHNVPVLENIILSGFEPFWEELALISGKIPTALLSSKANALLIQCAVEFGARAVHIATEEATSEFIHQAHAKKLVVRAFTVNDPADIRRLAAMRADAIFSDAPGLAVQVLRDAAAR